MKTKAPVLVFAAALLAACNAPAIPEELSNLLPSSEEATSQNQNTSEAVTSQGGQSTSEQHTSQGGQTTSEPIHTSQGGQTTSEEEVTSDLDGFEEEATAPEGIVLTDWTDEMKAILSSHLNGVIPPFVWLEGLTVAYDNMGYTKVLGTANANTASDYASALLAEGWDGYTDTDSIGLHIYSRLITDDGIIEGDALINSKNYFSCNYEFYPTDTSWPTGYFGMAMEEYGSNAELPVLPATSYIAQINALYDVTVFCVGADYTCFEDYAEALEENRWTVTSEGSGSTIVYTATSLDNLAKLTFYYDGTLVVMILEHGEGEIYTTWADCLAAIDDFATHDLRLSGAISDDIPEVTGGLQYTIDRSVRGRLTINVLKNTSFRLDPDVFDYQTALGNSGFETRLSGYEDQLILWAFPTDHSYAIEVELTTYISELGDSTSQFTITIQDYRVYLGYNVSGTWPEAQVATIVGNVAPSSVVPGYNQEGATYYAKSNLTDEIIIEIVNPGLDPVETYKQGLEDNYGYTSTASGNGYVSVDRKKAIQAQYEMVGDEFHIVIRQYVAPIPVDGDQATLAMANSSITNNASGWWWDVTFGSSPFSLRVEINSSSMGVGNSGDYIEPLRLYSGQKVTVAPAEGYKITQLDFYTITESSATGSYKNNNGANLSALSIDGATLDGSYNTVTGLTRYQIDDAHKSTGITFVVNGNFTLEEVVATVVAL